LRAARVGLLTALACGLGLGAGRIASGRRPQHHEVQMRNVTFAPSELEVAVGDTVEWKNVDIVRHDAFRPGAFETGELKPGERFIWVPSDTGSYNYRCSIHARMRGKIVVK
jgi:plastocyanin